MVTRRAGSRKYSLAVKYVKQVVENPYATTNGVIPTNRLRKSVKNLMHSDGLGEDDISMVSRGFLNCLYWMETKRIISRHNIGGTYCWGKPGIESRSDDDGEMADEAGDPEDEADDSNVHRSDSEKEAAGEEDDDDSYDAGKDPDPVAKSKIDDFRIKNLMGRMNTAESEIEAIDDLAKKTGLAVGAIAQQINELSKRRQVEFVITLPDKKVVKTKGKMHKAFEQVMFHISVGDNVMLVGPRGCGKTMLCEQLATHLKRKFGFISMSGGTTESKLYGKSSPNITNGKMEFHSTQFSDFYESGGLFLIDEVDAGDSNVLLSLNNPLDNKLLSLDRPKNPQVTMHDEFIAMSAANTWGNGADRQYVGRNQLDSAFVERWVQLDVDYDEELEIDLCPGKEEWVRKMHNYRNRIRESKLERTLSTRFICRAFRWMKAGKEEEYCDDMLFKGWRSDEVRKVKGY